MTVKELRDMLAQYPDDYHVRVLYEEQEHTQYGAHWEQHTRPVDEVYDDSIDTDTVLLYFVK